MSSPTPSVRVVVPAPSPVPKEEKKDATSRKRKREQTKPNTPQDGSNPRPTKKPKIGRKRRTATWDGPFARFSNLVKAVLKNDTPELKTILSLKDSDPRYVDPSAHANLILYLALAFKCKQETIDLLLSNPRIASGHRYTKADLRAPTPSNHEKLFAAAEELMTEAGRRGSVLMCSALQGTFWEKIDDTEAFYEAIIHNHLAFVHHFMQHSEEAGPFHACSGVDDKGLDYDWNEFDARDDEEEEEDSEERIDRRAEHHSALRFAEEGIPRTPLGVAIKHGRPAIARRLLKRADVKPFLPPSGGCHSCLAPAYDLHAAMNYAVEQKRREIAAMIKTRLVQCIKHLQSQVTSKTYPIPSFFLDMIQ